MNGTKIMIAVFLFAVLVAIVMGVNEQREQDRFNGLPAWKQREEIHKNMRKDCAELLRSQELKLYSELSVDERRMRALCSDEFLGR